MVVTLVTAKMRMRQNDSRMHPGMNAALEVSNFTASRHIDAAGSSGWDKNIVEARRLWD
jgi:hypothetical protein